MTSKQIAVQYIGQKIDNPESIFNNIDTFKSILPWCRDAAREYFSTQKSKMFLLDHIDDVASIVDEYLISRTSKMYNKALISQNKLFRNLCSSEKTVAWIIDRWINTFINLTSNRAYKEYIDILKIKIIWNDREYQSKNNSNIEDILEIERVKKLSNQEKIKLLKEVWKQSCYDDFDEYEMKYLCDKLDLNLDQIFENKDYLSKLNLRKLKVVNCNFQLEVII